jgi:hypothetical protein
VNQFRSSATSRFWRLFAELPVEVQELAIEKYEVFKRDPYHPSLAFQAKGKVWTLILGDLTAPLRSDLKTTSRGFGSEAMRITTTS